MHLGIFAKTFSRPTLAETLDAVVANGLDCIQFNFSCAGLPSMPETISDELAKNVSCELEKRKIEMAAVSGTFNLIHPDLEKRRDGFRRLAAMARICPILKTSVITLCTGTRDVENMWRHHPQNSSPEAWRDLISSVAAALEMTEPFSLTLGIEPETSNVIDSVSKARRLLDEMKSPRLKIIFDAANLFHPGDLPREREMMDEAFDLLGADMIGAHAKDVREENGVLIHGAAGKGALDFDRYIAKLREVNFTGRFVLHGLEESEVGGSLAFLRTKLKSAGSSPVAGGIH